MDGVVDGCHRECVSLLPRVCELLAASGSCLPDDTSLEKLLDCRFTILCLIHSLHTQLCTSLHENFPCLLEFISTVTHNTASDPAVICFMIKLTGVMASTVEGFQILQERLTVDEVFKVQRWQGAGLWEDPSVRSGWIHGLRNMMQHPGALSFFIQSEMMGHLFLLQTDSSLFVASSANQLLAHILLFYQPESPLTDSKDHSYKETHLKQNDSEPSSLLISTSYNTVVMSTCDYLKQSLLPKEQKQLQQSARLLRLITQILSQAGAPLWDKVSEAVSGPLKDLVTTENSQLTVPLMEVILAANWYVNKIQVPYKIDYSYQTVLHKCYQAVLKWTSVCTDLSWMSYQLRQDLLRVVQKRVCDLRWEVRDSTVEFLGQQAALAPSSSIPSQSLLLLDECSTLPLLREALQDQENYVRASAVSALAQALQRGWSQGATDIVTKLLSILCEDTEGFSRRAVVQYFISWFSSSSSSPSLLMSSIPSILSHGSSDLDWEVKVHTLELATLLMDSTLAGHLTQPWHPYAAISQPTYNFSSQNSETNVEDSLSKLIEQGVISTLFSGFYDCDRPVGLKACQLLISLQETLKKSECTVKCSLPSWGWGQEIRALMGNLNGSDLVNVQEVLRCLNLEQRLCVLSQSSDHVQNSPLSLLQDILTARDVHSHAGTAEGQEIIVDCY
uniref:BRCA1-associated ATM activator 1 n=1 Tax=Periophthalmus magnuspinnatus TaxID=409849 RepID=A0A3B4AT30_9GOBI